MSEHNHLFYPPAPAPQQQFEGEQLLVADTGGITVEVPVASLSVVAFAPDVQTPVTVTVPTASVTLTGFAPDVQTPVTVTVPTASIAVSGFAPTVELPVVVPTASLSIVTFAPFVDTMECLPPDAILVQTGLAGTLADIDEDPDQPDAAWLTSDASDGELRLSFGSPSGNLLAGAGLQEFKFYLRKDAAGPNPTYTAELWEAGSFVSTLATDVAITSEAGQLETIGWDSAVLSDPSGADVELRLTFAEATA